MDYSEGGEITMNLSKLRDKLVRMKFEFDIGISFMSFLTFSLLVIAASDGIQKVWKIPTSIIWIILVPMAFAGTWLFGLILEKFFKFQTVYNQTQNDKVPQMIILIDGIKDIQSKLNKMEDRFRRK